MSTLATTLRKHAWRAYGSVERHLLPGLRHAPEVYESVLVEALAGARSWLDVGCGWHTFPTWRADAERRAVAGVNNVVGIDMDVPALRRHRSIRRRVAASVTDLPFPDASFDVVSAAMVVEHLEHPERDLGEVRRVLRPGGLFIFHTPNARGYQIRLGRALPQPLKTLLVRLVEGRAEEDVYPAHYRANDPDVLPAVAAAAGLEVRELRLVLTHAEFAVFLPLALFEMLWLRLLRSERLHALRPNIIGILAVPSPVSRARQERGSPNEAIECPA